MKIITYMVQYHDKFRGVEGHDKTRLYESLDMAISEARRFQKDPNIVDLHIFKQTSRIKREEIEIGSTS